VSSRRSPSPSSSGLHRIPATLALIVAAALFAGAACGGGEASESWYEIRMGGTKVGYGNETISVASDGALVTTLDTSMLLERLGVRVEISSSERWVERMDGEPVEYVLVRNLGASVTELHLSFDGGDLVLSKSGPGETSTDRRPLPGRILFPRGVAALHRSRSDTPGGTFSYYTFDADFERVARHAVTTLGPDTVVVLGETRALTKSEVSSDLYAGAVWHEWRDGDGRLWAEEMPDLGLRRERTTQGQALAAEHPLDIISSTMIGVADAPSDPGRVDAATYEVWLEDGDIAAVLPEDGRQSFLERTGRGVLLRVRRVTPERGAPLPVEEPGSSEHTASNALMQCTNPVLREWAREAVAGSEDDAWAAARRIERSTCGAVREKGLGTAFASALETLESGEGDCSEHAVLAAAAARAVGIPSKVVSGLVLSGDSFAYHMWFEVWTGDGWYALDATAGEGSVDATHIKLSESSLSGGQAGDLSVGILKVMSRIGIEIVDVETEPLRGSDPAAAH